MKDKAKIYGCKSAYSLFSGVCVKKDCYRNSTVVSGKTSAGAFARTSAGDIRKGGSALGFPICVVDGRD